MVGSVAIVHAVLFLAFLTTPIRERVPHEISLVLIGGPVAEKSEAPKRPEMVVPIAADVPPPEVIVDVTPAINTSQPIQQTGSSNVTRPAEAMAEAHPFPFFPPKIPRTDGAVRLLLSITPTGTVLDATVDRTSGIAALDRFAIEWVKTHWRYQPALRGGEPIAVTTTAVIRFVTRA